MDEELAAEAAFLGGETDKHSADTGSTRNAIRLKDVHPTQEDIDLKRLKRDLRMEALRRMEEFARYPWEYQKVADTWNLLDANRQRSSRHAGCSLIRSYRRGCAWAVRSCSCVPWIISSLCFAGGSLQLGWLVDTAVPHQIILK